MSLFPGDIIACGTNAGLGPMEHGDIIEISVQGVGKVTNKLNDIITFTNNFKNA